MGGESRELVKHSRNCLSGVSWGEVRGRVGAGVKESGEEL